MNANELADLLEVDSWYKLVTREEITTMLRQQEVEIERITSKYEEILHEQQVEIEALKKELALWRLSKSSEEIEQVPTNPTLMGGLDEPVGHFYPEGEGATIYDIKFAWKVTGTTEPIPLYTHPAKTEEFMAGDAICPSCGCKSLYKTARSEWCVTHKCLWQKDYDLTLTNEEIDLTGKTNEGILQLFYMIKGDVTGLQFKEALRDFARAILRKAQEK